MASAVAESAATVAGLVAAHAAAGPVAGLADVAEPVVAAAVAELVVVVAEQGQHGGWPKVNDEN